MFRCYNNKLKKKTVPTENKIISFYRKGKSTFWPKS